MHSYLEDDAFKEESKYVPAENGMIFTPMLKKTTKLSEDETNINQTEKDEERIYTKLPFHYQHQQASVNNLVNSFRNELNYKLKKQRDDIDSKLETPQQHNNNDTPNGAATIIPYETSSASSSTSNNDLLNSNNNLITTATLKKERPPILKPKPRNLLNYSVHYSEVPKNLVTATNNSSSPSTSITDISTSNMCSPQHYELNDSDKYPMIPSRSNSLLKSKQRPPAPPPPPASSLSASSSTVTTTFNKFLIKHTNNNEVNDVNLVNTLRRQNVVRNSDC